MRIAPAFPISPLIAIPSKFLTTVATSLIAVPSVLHVMAHRRVTCEFPGGLSYYYLLQKKRKKKKVRTTPGKSLLRGQRHGAGLRGAGAARCRAAERTPRAQPAGGQESIALRRLHVA
eukprot:scaffold29661_cov157-Isochrysis_galbana.AAC.3